MAQVSGWVWEENVRSAVEHLATWVGYSFDGSDWEAIETGLPSTDADDPDAWYEYPLDGDPELRLRLAINPGAAPVMVQVEGELDATLEARVDTLLSLLAGVREVPGPMAARGEAQTYLEAAASFADLVASLPASLSGPGLGDWDLRALVGHTSRSLVTVLEYLEQPTPALELESAAAYYVAIDGATAGPGVLERGVAAGEALGPDPAAYVRSLLDQVTAALAGADPDQVIQTFAGGSRLRDYLPTRTFELVVHGLDIAAAVPARWTPPPAALRAAVALAGEVAVLRGEGAMLLRLVTGREPGGISIV